MKQYLPLSYRLIRGSIGKEIVIKHYRYGIVTSKYPDMSNVVASDHQAIYRKLFKEAVKYARSVINDPLLKSFWQKKLRRTNGVYNAAVKEYMLNHKRAKENAELETKRLLRKALHNKEAAVKIQSFNHSGGKQNLTRQLTLNI
ncbi:MAG TPA: hypothetical protein VK498_04990 [Ferruginibacter sp.]|nr:hypothetical protein [Ferruginibacter sp.]